MRMSASHIQQVSLSMLALTTLAMPPLVASADMADSSQTISVNEPLISAVPEPPPLRLSSHILFQSNSRSDSIPIWAFFNELKTSEPGRGNFSYSKNKFEIGAKLANWTLAAIYRYDYYLRYTPDTAEIVIGDANARPLQENKSYQVYLEAKHLASKGLKLQYDTQFDVVEGVSVDLRPSLSLLDSIDIYNGRITGGFENGVSGPSGLLRLDYVYRNGLFIELPARGNPSGRGFAADLALTVDLPAHWRFEAQIDDIYSRIRYNNVSFTTLTLNTNTVSIENGIIEGRPALSGQRGGRDHQLTVPRFERYAISRQIGGNRYSVEWSTLESIADLSTGWTRQWANGTSIHTKINWFSQSATAGFRLGQNTLSLTLDSLNLKQVKTFTLAYSYLH